MNDLISREAVITAVTEYAAWLWRTYREPCNLQGYIEAIERVPSAQVRQNGRWEEKEVIHKGEAQSFIEEWQSARCSHCGKYHTTPYLYYFSEYAYCPHCGAEMENSDG